jgi:hypothetical protein
VDDVAEGITLGARLGVKAKVKVKKLAAKYDC